MTSSISTRPAAANVPVELPAAVASEISRLGIEKHGYVFGHKLANSFSPFLHDVIYRHLGLRWKQFRLESDNVENFLKLAQHPDFYGT